VTSADWREWWDASWSSRRQRLLDALPDGVPPIWAEFVEADFQLLEPNVDAEDQILGFTEPGRPLVLRDPYDFVVLVTASFRPRGGTDATAIRSLDCRATTPRTLIRLLQSGEWKAPDGLLTSQPEPSPWTAGFVLPILLMEEWSQDRVVDQMRRLAEQVGPAPDWDAVTDRLGRALTWDDQMHFDEAVNRQGPRYGLTSPADQ
jgi:hypothetical protein